MAFACPARQAGAVKNSDVPPAILDEALLLQLASRFGDGLAAHAEDAGDGDLGHVDPVVRQAVQSHQ